MSHVAIFALTPHSRRKQNRSKYNRTELCRTLIFDIYSRLFFRVKLKDITPTLLDFKGNYGVAINWSDGHFADIFPFDILRELGEKMEKEKSR